MNRSGSSAIACPMNVAIPEFDGRRLDVSVPGAERLPLDRQETMPLEIAEGAVVREHVEALAIAAAVEGLPE